MNSTAPMESTASPKVHRFEFSDDFRKPQTLVSRYDWQIEDSQIVVEGDVACTVTRKLLWFKKRGPVKQRYVILTSKGALIIYETEYAGYVIDLQKTVSISTSSEMFSTRRKHYRRCDMKICVPQGSIKFHLINEDIPKWRDTLMAVHEGFVEKFHTLKPDAGDDAHDSTVTCAGNESEDTVFRDSPPPSAFIPDKQQLRVQEQLTTFHSGGMAANVSTKSDLYAISPDVQSDTRSAKSRNREEEGFSESDSETGSGLFMIREEETREAVTSIRSGYVSVKDRKREFEQRGTIIQCKRTDSKQQPYAKPIMFPQAATSTKLGVYDPKAVRSP
ncbi:hypothetical protein WR25_14009 isoform C [Diploscapter pachys]|uniref:DUF7778 domain-containing protein n=1 Tax=Diploscapter pachys TaxID=2018661 RepID=A0A2A2KVM8_9BILA|nr:hypothetical protein WR25_14009 isoform A [Diploscapter pachys]PAV77917.1 hypothetical protein WR25_14009 isoform C [Diploscapter pachys]